MLDMIACESDDGCLDLETLFTSHRYEAEVFQHGALSISLLCSTVACTDYDLTGQIIWPAARLLAEYLSENCEQVAHVRDACELGSGLGLAGLICGQFVPTVLTDHNATVLEVLQKNVARNQSNYPMRCMLMDWGDDSQIAAVKELSYNGQGYQLLVGADVCYSVNALGPLFRAASALLAPSSDAFFLLAYVSRSALLDKGVIAEAEAAGLTISEVQCTRRTVDGEPMKASFTDCPTVLAGPVLPVEFEAFMLEPGMLGAMTQESALLNLHMSTVCKPRGGKSRTCCLRYATLRH